MEKRGKGRPKGSLNKFSELRNALLDAFYSDKLGGVEGLTDWASQAQNRSKFYEMICRLLPRNIEMEPVDIRVSQMNELFERMTEAELLKYAEKGELPTWFTSTTPSESESGRH